MERIILIFTSDHGDLCGEHGRYNKSVPMEASARVPFVIHAPGRIKPEAVVHRVLGSVDFKPTVLSLMGVEPGDNEGRNAAESFRSGEDVEKNMTFIRIGKNVESGWMGVFTPRYKLVVAPGANP